MSKRRIDNKKSRIISVCGIPKTTGQACRDLGTLVFYESLMSKFGTLTSSDAQRQEVFDQIYETARRKYICTRDNKQMPEY